MTPAGPDYMALAVCLGLSALTTVVVVIVIHRSTWLHDLLDRGSGVSLREGLSSFRARKTIEWTEIDEDDRYRMGAW